MPVAIVAIVAMFLAFLWGASGSADRLGLHNAGSTPAPSTTEVILYIEPRKQIVYVTPPSLPERNPHR